MEFLAIYRDYVTLDMIWLGVAVLALVVKCFTREYVSLCVAIGALAAFVVSVTIFHGHLLYQVITAVAVAFILAIFIQPYAMHKIHRPHRQRNAGGGGREGARGGPRPPHPAGDVMIP